MEHRIAKLCVRCGITKPLAEFYYDRGYPMGHCKQCSSARCRRNHQATYVPVEGATRDLRPCAHCGTEYRPKHRIVSKFCSPRCKDLGRRPEPAARTCPYCDGDIPPSKRAGTLFCSKRCNDAAHRLQSKLRTRSGEVAKPGYLRAEIARRDAWTCQICLQPVDRELWYPDRWSGSLDHIVPVSHGGSSDPANLRLTHLVCNQLRGNRVPRG